jgi:hypothetical protein
MGEGQGGKEVSLAPLIHTEAKANFSAISATFLCFSHFPVDLPLL